MRNLVLSVQRYLFSNEGSAGRGAVRQTLTCLHLGRPKPLMGMIFREADFVQASPISG